MSNHTTDTRYPERSTHGRLLARIEELGAELRQVEERNAGFIKTLEAIRETDSAAHARTLAAEALYPAAGTKEPETWKQRVERMSEHYGLPRLLPGAKEPERRNDA